MRGPLRIWQMPDPARVYALGADPGGGKSARDYSAASVIAVDDGSQCATYHGRLEPLDFAEVIYLLARFYGGIQAIAYTCIEINQHGLAVLEKVRTLGHPNLYTRQTWDQIEKVMQPQLGWMTSVKTRPMLVNRARAALADPSVKIFDPELIAEMSTFVFTETGREDHLDGCHDDLLFAWMLALEASQHLKEVRPEAIQIMAERSNPDQWVWDALQAKVEEREVMRVHYEDPYGDF